MDYLIESLFDFLMESFFSKRKKNQFVPTTEIVSEILYFILFHIIGLVTEKIIKISCIELLYCAKQNIIDQILYKQVSGNYIQQQTITPMADRLDSKLEEKLHKSRDDLYEAELKLERLKS